MTAHSASPGRQEQLEGELLRLAQRGVKRTFAELQKNGPLSLPVLFGIASRWHGDGWSEADTQAKALILKAVIATAVEMLPDDTSVPDTTITWRRLGRIVFSLDGLDETPVEISESNRDHYDKMFAYAKLESGFSKTDQSFSDRLRKLRRHLARVLLSLEADRRSVVSVYSRCPVALGSTQANFDNPYIETDWTTPLWDSVRRGQNTLISITGEPGVGKSRLVYELCARNLQSNDYISLNAGNESDLAHGLTWFLSEQCGLRVESSLTARMQQFREALERNTELSLVILDDVPNEQLVRELIGYQHRPSVVVTSTRQIKIGHEYSLHPLAHSQARQLATTDWPGVEPWVPAALDYMTAGRPGLIRQIISFLKAAQGHVDVFDIWHGLIVNPNTIFQLVEPDSQRRLSTYYANLMSRLAIHSPDMALAAALMALQEHCQYHPRVVATLLNHLIGQNEGIAQALVAKTMEIFLGQRAHVPERIWLDRLVSSIIRNTGTPDATLTLYLRDSLAARALQLFDQSNDNLWDTGLSDKWTDALTALLAVERHLGRWTATAFIHEHGSYLYDERGIRHTLSLSQPLKRHSGPMKIHPSVRIPAQVQRYVFESESTGPKRQTATRSYAEPDKGYWALVRNFSVSVLGTMSVNVQFLRGPDNSVGLWKTIGR